MHQYQTVAQALLILSVFNLVFAVPVGRGIHDARDNMVARVPVVVEMENVTAAMSKERRHRQSARGSEWSTLLDTPPPPPPPIHESSSPPGGPATFSTEAPPGGSAPSETVPASGQPPAEQVTPDMPAANTGAKIGGKEAAGFVIVGAIAVYFTLYHFLHKDHHD